MRPSDCCIVPMTEELVPQVAQLEAVCFHDPWSENSIRSELNNPLSLWLTAVQDGKVVGYVGSQTVLDEADVMNVAVSPEHRRSGIAAELMLELERTLAKLGVHSLTLEVRVSNEPAIRLYEMLGYVQVGLRPNYYLRPKEDAKILRKEWQI